MKKWILAIIAVLVLAAIGAGWYAYRNLDRIVAHVIETSGSEMTGSEVQVGDVQIGLTEGRASLSNLTVANPPGYSSEPAVRLGNISARVDYETRSISEIVATAPVIRLESRGDSTNLSEIRTHASRQSAQQGGTAGETEQARRYRIDRVEIRDARAVVVSDRMPEPREVSLGDLTFRNLEGTSDEIAAELVSQLTAQVLARAARGALRERLEERLGSELDKLKGLLGDD